MSRITRLRARSGYSLTELILVIACLVILAAFAVPSMIGSRGAAQDAQPEAHLTDTLHSARAIAAAIGDYENEAGLVQELEADNPQFTFVYCDGVQDRPEDISVPGCADKISQLSPTTLYVDLRPAATTGSEVGDEVTLCALSDSGRFFCLRSNERGHIQFVDDGA